MKVVFLQDVPNVAKAGDVKEVSEGFGRNLLLPRKLAVAATPDALKRVEAIRKAEGHRQARSEEEARAQAEQLNKLTLSFKAKTGGQERLYGSITSADIAAEIKKAAGLEIDKRKIELEHPIHTIGSYDVPVKLTKDAVATVKVVVEAEAEAKKE